jgi:alkanesulfonate monooxygenase SsuD/methylene tetrahydromethanopterin reductase-like flavin-dependent oxidoreductase (luciferase family)
VKIGAHLPLMDFGGHPYTLEHLTGYARTAARLGYDALTVNDHMTFSVPWLDGPTALAAVIDESDGLALATTVSLPVVRGPVALAKTLGAIDRLSGGRLIACLGPGSSRQDYDAVGIDFDERWKRLDEAIAAMRALWRGDGKPFAGSYYSTAGVELEPRPAQEGGPPIWVGSWGSLAGLRRTARLGDGWLASAYNTTPDVFADAWTQLRELLPKHGKDPDAFPNGLATMWFHITDDAREADRVVHDLLAPTVNRPEEVLRERLPIGPAERFAELLDAFARAGVQRVFIWPVADEEAQLERFAETVRPMIAS